MWVEVVDCKTGTVITDARFNFNWINEGGGLYWVEVGNPEELCATAPGFGQVCASTQDYTSMTYWICPAPPPPPPTSCDAWS